MSCLCPGLNLFVIWQPKDSRKTSWLALQFILRRRYLKLELKWKIWNCTCLLQILAKEVVGKRFFDLFAFYIDIKFDVKVISSLARVLQKVLGIGFFFIWFEVRFFNFAMNKANCDWLTLILNMAHLYQKQNHKHPYSFFLKESEGPGGVRRLHKYLWYFRQHFSNIGYWEYVSYVNNTMLGNSIEKKWKWYRQHWLSKSQQSTFWLASIFSSASST